MPTSRHLPGRKGEGTGSIEPEDWYDVRLTVRETVPGRVMRKAGKGREGSPDVTDGQLRRT